MAQSNSHPGPRLPWPVSGSSSVPEVPGPRSAAGDTTHEAGRGPDAGYSAYDIELDDAQGHWWPA